MPAQMSGSDYNLFDLPSMTWYKIFSFICSVWILLTPLLLFVSINDYIYAFVTFGLPSSAVFANPLVQWSIAGTALLWGITVKLRVEIGKYSPVAIPLCIYFIIARVIVSGVSVALSIYYLGVELSAEAVASAFGSVIPVCLLLIPTYFYLKKRKIHLATFRVVERMPEGSMPFKASSPFPLECAAKDEVIEAPLISADCPAPVKSIPSAGPTPVKSKVVLSKRVGQPLKVITKIPQMPQPITPPKTPEPTAQPIPAAPEFPVSAPQRKKKGSGKNIIIAALAVLLVANIVFSVYQARKVGSLEAKEQAAADMRETINTQSNAAAQFTRPIYNRTIATTAATTTPATWSPTTTSTTTANSRGMTREQYERWEKGFLEAQAANKAAASSFPPPADNN